MLSEMRSDFDPMRGGRPPRINSDSGHETPGRGGAYPSRVINHTHYWTASIDIMLPERAESSPRLLTLRDLAAGRN